MTDTITVNKIQGKIVEIISINPLNTNNILDKENNYNLSVKYLLKYSDETTGDEKMEGGITFVVKSIEDTYLLCLIVGYKIPKDIKQEYEDLILENTLIHIRVQQRNNRKHYTICEGLPQKINFERILKAFRNNFKCNGNINKDSNDKTIIQLQQSKIAT